MRIAFRSACAAALALLFLAACRGSSSNHEPVASTTSVASSIDSGSASTAVAVTSTGGIAVATPIDVGTSPEIQAAAKGAAAISDALDAKCATLPMSPGLSGLRPGGTGCPRTSIAGGIK